MTLDTTPCRWRFGLLYRPLVRTLRGEGGSLLGVGDFKGVMCNLRWYDVENPKICHARGKGVGVNSCRR